MPVIKIYTPYIRQCKNAVYSCETGRHCEVRLKEPLYTLDYGVIGNCRAAALVSKTGGIDWLCFPDFDSPSICAAILDRDKGGSLGFILPEGTETEQSYLGATNILRTVFISEHGVFEVLDFMPRYMHSPTEGHMPPEVYRIVRPLSGRPRFRVTYDPEMNYARGKTAHRIMNGFIRSASEEDDNDNMYLYSSIAPEVILEGREVILERDEYMLVSYWQKLVRITIDYAMLEFERTKVYWLNWNDRSVKLSEYGDMVSRSLLVLKLMSYDQSGAILAAVTTSIPETIGGVRNWDYRYCWIRDASMSISTLMRMGHHNAAQRFMGFLKNIIRTKNDKFQIMYGIRGERKLTEETLDHLSGFANSRPVRIGNAAYGQRQNDSLGYLLEVIYHNYKYFPGPLEDLEEMWGIVKKMVKTVEAEWEQPDNSIWEFRDKADHFVFSKVMSWVALDRAARIAGYLRRPDYERRIRRTADVIRTDVLAKGWNPRINSFSQAYGNDDVDSSLLLMERYGFIEADDPRYVLTVDRIRDELLRDGLMFRYKNSDDFGRPESAFTICTFWMARALYVTGRRAEARELFERVVGSSNHVGLFSEDLDFATRGQLGNFPQAYSHLALIDVASLFGERIERQVRPTPIEF